MKPFHLLFSFSLLFLLGCQNEISSTESSAPYSLQETPPVAFHPDPFVQSIEKAHSKSDFFASKNVSFDLELWFGGKKRMDGTISMACNTSKLRLDLPEEGISLIYDGDSVYQTPDTASYGRARFDIFTWTYFFALPYKLNDPGVLWTDTPFNTLNGVEYDSKKLSFEDGTGDSSLDWYIVYADKEERLLRYAAYIVTMTKSQEEAEEDPHAIGYSDYQKVDGIPIPMRWTFFGWREEQGLTDTLGHAILTNVNFMADSGTLFDRPETYKLITYERPAAPGE